MKSKFLVIVEKGESNYSAYSPDIPGCISTGKSVESTLKNMREACEFHFEGLLQNAYEIPEQKGLTYYLEKTDEISSDDILAHIEIDVPELAAA